MRHVYLNTGNKFCWIKWRGLFLWA